MIVSVVSLGVFILVIIFEVFRCWFFFELPNSSSEYVFMLVVTMGILIVIVSMIMKGCALDMLVRIMRSVSG